MVPSVPLSYLSSSNMVQRNTEPQPSLKVGPSCLGVSGSMTILTPLPKFLTTIENIEHT